MRITNSMMTNRMMLNINRNMSYLDSLYTQIATGKNIQVPSDDPILANRALRFRTAVAETVQYQRNATQALSWMDVTESSFNNITDVLQSIREKCEEAASDTKTFEDQQTLISSIVQLFEQICSEMNGTYAGKYVFSGYRTDEPVTLENDLEGVSYEISQSFDFDDIEKTISYWKPEDEVGMNAEFVEVNILKLPYNDATDLEIPGFDIVTKSLSDATNPYDVSAYEGTNTIVYIPETGELVIPDSIAADSSNFEFEYSDEYYEAYDMYKTQLEDYKANLAVYNNLKLEYERNLDAYEENLRDYHTGVAEGKVTPATYNLDGTIANYNDMPIPPTAPEEPIEPCPPLAPDIFGDELAAPDDYGTYINTYLTTDTAAYDTYLANLSVNQTEYGVYSASYQEYRNEYNAYVNSNYRNDTPTFTDQAPVYEPQTAYTTYTVAGVDGNIVLDPYSPRAIGAEFSLGFNVVYTKNSFEKGELNPLTNFNCRDVNTGTEYFFSEDTQSICYELGTNTLVAVNSIGNQVLTDDLYADLKAICELVGRIELSDQGALEDLYGAAPYNLEGDELASKVEEHLAIEREEISKVLNDRFGNMLDIIDDHSAQIAREQSDLGSRMYRVDLINNRLADDYVTYSDLQSQNEDADMVEAAVLLSAAEAIYQASLMAGSKIIQTTLADYI